MRRRHTRVVLLTSSVIIGAAAVACGSGDYATPTATAPESTSADVATPPKATVAAPIARDYRSPEGVAAPPLFIVTWEESRTPPGGLLRPIDAATGEDMAGFEPIDIMQAVTGIVSPSGARLFATNAVSGSAPGATAQVIDLETWSGTPLGGAISWAGSTWLADESAFIQANWFGLNGLQLWRVDTSTAETALLATLDVRFGSNVALSPGGDVLYAVAFESADGYVTERDAFVVAVDLEDGSSRHIGIPGLKAGQYHETDDSGQTYGSYRPAIALTPDGATLYVAHAESEAITAIETATGQIVGTTSVARKPSRFERFGSWLAGAIADTAEAKGGPSTTRDLRITPDGAHLVVGGWVTERCPEVECFSGTADLRVIEAATLREVLRVPRGGQFALSEDGAVAVAVGRWQGPPIVGDWLTLSGAGVTIIDMTTLTAEAVPGARSRYQEVVVAPDGSLAFALSNEPGEAAVRETGEWCAERCFALATIDLRSGELVGERILDAAWAQLVGPE